MVYSASSARTLLEGHGDGTAYLVKYLMYGAVGLVAMQLLARYGLEHVRRITPALLLGSFVLLVLVLIPGFGVSVNGARRWLGAGPLQFQPAELMKLALVLHAAAMLSAKPKITPNLRRLAGPIFLPAGLRRAADRRPARPRHRAGDRLHARRDARRGRAPAAPARADRRRRVAADHPVRPAASPTAAPG